MTKYFSSNPANVRIDIVHFLKCDLKDVIILAVGIIIAGIALPYSGIGAFTAFGTGLWMLISSVNDARWLFKNGDVCPAIVVDPDCNLVAVFADLTQGRSSDPIVLILKQPLGKTTGGPFKRGTKLAFVAMYHGYENQPSWKAISGYLINSSTTNKKTIHRVLSSIPEREWQKLKGGLRELERPFRKGQHEVDV